MFGLDAWNLPPVVLCALFTPLSWALLQPQPLTENGNFLGDVDGVRVRHLLLLPVGGHASGSNC